MAGAELDVLRRGEAFAETVARLCRAASEARGIRPLAPSWLAIFALEQAELEGQHALARLIDAAVELAHEEDSDQVERRHLFPTPRDWPTMKQATEEFQVHYLREALEREQWNVATVARVLGFSRPYVHTMIKRAKIQRPRKTPAR